MLCVFVTVARNQRAPPLSLHAMVGLQRTPVSRCIPSVPPPRQAIRVARRKHGPADYPLQRGGGAVGHAVPRRLLPCSSEYAPHTVVGLSGLLNVNQI